MDRKEFLIKACGLGICGCAMSLASVPQPLAAQKSDEPDRRLVFARYQLAKMLGFMASDAPPAICAQILEKTGRECARVGQMPGQFKGDPDGYFAAAKKNWGTDFSWDRQNGVVTVAVAEGPCGCPLADSRRTPALWCNCSVGYQKVAFESVFGRPVHVSLRASKLGGAKRCVFEVRLS